MRKVEHLLYELALARQSCREARASSAGEEPGEGRGMTR